MYFTLYVTITLSIYRIQGHSFRFEFSIRFFVYLEVSKSAVSISIICQIFTANLLIRCLVTSDLIP